MAKKPKTQTDDQIDEVETDAVNDTPEQPDLTDLVPMHKDGKRIHAHPTLVEHHQKNGWKLA